jgi:hypothetical protein
MHFLSFIVYTFLFVLAGFPGLIAQEKADATSNFPSAVVRPTLIDMGIAETGSMMRGRFTIYNEGKEALLIAGVRSSCGMMIPSWPSAPIVPGDSAIIQLRYDTSRVGPFTRLLTIHSNARQKTLVVGVHGEVRSKTAHPVR